MPSDQFSKRLANQNAILQSLHRDGPAQRSDLSRALGIRKSSVTSIVTQLIDEGILRPSKADSRRSPVELDPDRHHALAVSVSPSSVNVARVYCDGRLGARASAPVGADDELMTVMNTTVTLLSRLQSESDGSCLGVGVSVPGVVDPRAGVCLRAVNLRGWNNVPLAHMLQVRVGRPVHIDNDVRCQLWSCSWFDHVGKDAESVIYVHLHDGVACAIMTQGRLVHGDRLSAGEIGHVSIDDEGRVCTCGRVDCLETYVSLPAIMREVHSIRPALQIAGAAELVRASAETPAIETILDRAASRIARAISGLVAAMDPKVVVVGTAHRQLSELLAPLLRRHLYNELIGLQASEANILAVEDVETASLRGAGGLVLDEAYRMGRFGAENA